MMRAIPSGYTAEELRYLQRLRNSVVDLQAAVAPLAADARSDTYNEQFNQLRLEAKVLLKDPAFEQKVPRAVTEVMWNERSQRTIFPRLSAITFLGVILALVGLGVNSIILEDVLVNSLGCCVSGGGMLLVIGAFAVWSLTSTRRRLTNLGDLYARCETLLAEIDNTLDTAVPDPAAGPAAVPSAADLMLNSLRSQVAHWQETIRDLESQRLRLGPEAPVELTDNIDLAEQELNRVIRELNRLQAEEPATSGPARRAGVPIQGEVIIPPGGRPGAPRVKRSFDSQAVVRARQNTMDMPAVGPEETPDLPPDTEEEDPDRAAPVDQ